MGILRFYIIGVLVCFLISLLLEHFYFGSGRSETVHLDTIGANFLYSLLSWIGILGEIVFWLGEIYTDFPELGKGEFMHDYEEQLKEEQEEKEKRD